MSGHNVWRERTIPLKSGHNVWRERTIPLKSGHNVWRERTIPLKSGHNVWRESVFRVSTASVEDNRAFCLGALVITLSL